MRKRVTCAKGDKVTIPTVAKNSGNSASVIASISIEGVQSVTVVDNDEEGNINGLTFINDILVLCEPYSAERSVIVMDDAAVHMKHQIIAACAAVNVLILFLPSYSFDFNPIELLFNIGKDIQNCIFFNIGIIYRGDTVAPRYPRIVKLANCLEPVC